MRARARGGELFSSYNQMMRKAEFFKMVSVTFETQVYEVQKMG